MATQIVSAQEPARGFAGYCPYGCGPYVPLITTPSVSFQTISPNPVGARNATAGLVAGATDSTLSEESGNTSSVYTMPVWYSGGGMPLVAPAVNSPVGTMRPGRFEAMHREPEMHERKAEPQAWTYIAAVAPSEGVHSLEAASAATGVKPAKHSYTNEDVQKENDKNGYVHYDGKTEKIQ
ncbi:MAG TPA: hypothetical protein VGG14_04170 [Candidatus Sulfotelmatobacter sp.]